MRFGLLTGLLLIAPLPLFGASFARESLFLSKTPVVDGETVLIHAVVANESNVKFVGDVVLKVGEARIGSVAVTIAPGGANAVSVSWKPTAGSHKIVAELTTVEGTIVESESATFTINEKPKPAGTSGTAATTSIESSADIQDKINSTLPAVSGISEPIFTTLDSARASAAALLDRGIDWAKQKTDEKKPGEILGSATENKGGFIETALLMFATVMLYIFSVLRFVVGNAGLFYPVFVVLFFYALWRIFRRIRRPSYG